MFIKKIDKYNNFFFKFSKTETYEEFLLQEKKIPKELFRKKKWNRLKTEKEKYDRCRKSHMQRIKQIRASNEQTKHHKLHLPVALFSRRWQDFPITRQ